MSVSPQGTISARSGSSPTPPDASSAVSATPAGLIRDLQSAGVPVGDLWDLVNAKVQYRSAIPVLIDWLQDVDSRVAAPDQPKVREGPVRH
jgi:hypothetical protein